MKLTVRWIWEAIVLYAAIFWPLARLVHENPSRMWELAIPPIFVLLIVVLVWPKLIRLLGAKDSLGVLLLFTFFSALVSTIASSLFWAFLAGGFRSDLGEHGGAILLIMVFTSALFSCLALPLALIFPRLIDPVLRLGIFCSSQ